MGCTPWHRTSDGNYINITTGIMISMVNQTRWFIEVSSVFDLLPRRVQLDGSWSSRNEAQDAMRSVIRSLDGEAVDVCDWYRK